MCGCRPESCTRQEQGLEIGWRQTPGKDRDKPGNTCFSFDAISNRSGVAPNPSQRLAFIWSPAMPRTSR